MNHKICFCIDSLTIGGSTQVVFDVVSELSATSIVHLIVFFNNVDEKYNELLRNKNIKVYFLNKKQGFDILFLGRLRKTIREIKPDIISSHLSCTFYLSLVVNPNKILIYHTIHSLPSFDLPRIYRLFLQRRIKKNMIRLIGCSKYVTNEARLLYKVDVQTIENGILLPKFKERLEKHYDLCCVGRFCTNKHFMELLEAINELKNIGINCRLCICGDGPEKMNLIEYINNHKLSSLIKVFGKEKNVSDIYKDSKFYISFTEREGFPITYLEALAFGLPIISSNIPSIKEIVIDGYNGYLFDLYNKEQSINTIKTALKIEEYDYHKLSSNSKEIASNYTRQKMASKYFNLFVTDE